MHLAETGVTTAHHAADEVEVVPGPVVESQSRWKERRRVGLMVHSDMMKSSEPYDQTVLIKVEYPVEWFNICSPPLTARS